MPGAYSSSRDAGLSARSMRETRSSALPWRASLNTTACPSAAKRAPPIRPRVNVRGWKDGSLSGRISNAARAAAMRIDAVVSAPSVILSRCGEGGGADVLVDGSPSCCSAKTRSRAD